jgi:hypothetical protein
MSKAGWASIGTTPQSITKKPRVLAERAVPLGVILPARYFRI